MAHFYNLWHKSLNRSSTLGLTILADNKKQALERSGYAAKVKAIGGKLSDIQCNKIHVYTAARDAARKAIHSLK
jgi:hypothetical protein